jgi:predicted nucleic acid-binding protein
MRVLLDTSVILDVLLEQQPWFPYSDAVWQAHESGRVTAYVIASALTDIFYIARRVTGLEQAHKAVRACLTTFEICLVDRQVLEQAVLLTGSDFEDNLQIACATIAGLDAIITRDKRGFKVATLPVLTPAELLAQLN